MLWESEVEIVHRTKSLSYLGSMGTIAEIYEAIYSPDPSSAV